MRSSLRARWGWLIRTGRDWRIGLKSEHLRCGISSSVATTASPGRSYLDRKTVRTSARSRSRSSCGAGCSTLARPTKSWLTKTRWARFRPSVAPSPTSSMDETSQSKTLSHLRVQKSPCTWWESFERPLSSCSSPKARCSCLQVSWPATGHESRPQRTPTSSCVMAQPISGHFVTTSTRFSSPALRSSIRTRRVDASIPPWRSRPPRCCSSLRPFSWEEAFWWLRCWVARLQQSPTTPWRCGPSACHATTLVWQPGSPMWFRLWWQCRFSSGWRFCSRFGSRSGSVDGSIPTWATTWIGPWSARVSSPSWSQPFSLFSHRSRAGWRTCFAPTSRHRNRSLPSVGTCCHRIGRDDGL